MLVTETFNQTETEHSGVIVSCTLEVFNGKVLALGVMMQSNISILTLYMQTAIVEHFFQK